jgi:hypothetical protein
VYHGWQMLSRRRKQEYAAAGDSHMSPVTLWVINGGGQDVGKTKGAKRWRVYYISPRSRLLPRVPIVSRSLVAAAWRARHRNGVAMAAVIVTVKR